MRRRRSCERPGSSPAEPWGGGRPHAILRRMPRAPGTDDHLIHGIGVWYATALNMIDMVGVGPFITVPLIITAMHARRPCWAGLSARSS